MSFEEVLNYEPKLDFEWVNDTLYITQDKEIICKVSKEQWLEVCKKVDEDIAKKLDELLGGSNV